MPYGLYLHKYAGYEDLWVSSLFTSTPQKCNLQHKTINPLKAGIVCFRTSRFVIGENDKYSVIEKLQEIKVKWICLHICQSLKRWYLLIPDYQVS